MIDKNTFSKGLPHFILKRGNDANRFFSLIILKYIEPPITGRSCINFNNGGMGKSL